MSLLPSDRQLQRLLPSVFLLTKKLFEMMPLPDSAELFRRRPLAPARCSILELILGAFFQNKDRDLARFAVADGKTRLP